MKILKLIAIAILYILLGPLYFLLHCLTWVTLWLGGRSAKEVEEGKIRGLTWALFPFYWVFNGLRLICLAGITSVDATKA